MYRIVVFDETQPQTLSSLRSTTRTSCCCISSQRVAVGRNPSLPTTRSRFVTILRADLQARHTTTSPLRV